ncbi:helix-turn-helix domain-containing protein [Streptomyces sp. NBC_01335]|uniref:helix-turn-helix domain-containing protein n=1 Tax=Streptomyces sp. NBC_01335 TaxID=2903828 RepID=UPI002E118B6A|nr:helix-turn-helix domain-containing protein [Streptomyces sp. NBC_01335]
MSPVLLTSLKREEQGLAVRHDTVDRNPVPVTVVPHGTEPFTGRIVTERVGALRTSTVEAGARLVRRTKSHIERSPERLMAVGVQTTGRTVLVQAGRQVTADPGDLFVYDTSRPYFLDHPEHFSVHVVYIPRHALALSDEALDSIAGTAFTTGQGCAAVLKPVLTIVATSAHTCSASTTNGLVNGLIDLFATLVAERHEGPAEGAATTRHHLVRCVRRHIDENLGDPALSPESVARAHHISVRYLHRLFEDEGITVGRLIQRRRLERCAYELARRGRTMPTVSAVAQRWGFVNPAHFSRVFRGAYGLSPREWRALRHQSGATTRTADQHAGTEVTDPFRQSVR